MNPTPQTTVDPPQAHSLRVLLLGPLRLALHADEYRIACPADGSQQALWDSLLEVFPALRGSRNAIRIARNNQFLLASDKLQPGDEIALIPPVSGG